MYKNLRINVDLKMGIESEIEEEIANIFCFFILGPLACSHSELI
jgi:hypothetical protein